VPGVRVGQFPATRVKEVVVGKRGETAAAIVKAVHEAVATWTAGQPATDDITVVAVRRMV